MDHDPKIPAPNVILHAHKDWHLWFPLLEKHSRDRGVWEYIDPDVDTLMPAIESLEPVYPAIPPEPVKPTTPTSEPTPEYQVSLEEYNHKKAAYQLAVKNHEEDVRVYKVLCNQWVRKASKIANINEWINRTVSQDLLLPITMQLLRGTSTPQAVVRELKKHKWFNDWQALYAKAQAFELHEVRGDLAVTDFLDALAAKIAPDWARNLRQTITTASAMGQPTMSLDDVARVFNLTMQEHEAGGKGRSTGVFSTFGGESAPSGGNSGGSTGGPRKYCPCKPGKPSHYWEPIKCRRLQQAITGKSDPGPTPIHLSDTDTRMINQRLHSSKFSTLLTQLKQAGWKINPAQQTSEKSKTTNTIVACVIDPRTLRDLSNAIFNLNYGGHPFSYSTIFDGGGALHLANDRNLLVPGTYKNNLGGELPEGPEPVAGQPDDQEQGQAETERSDSLAGDHLRIRTGQNPGYGLATPEQTPEPHGSGMDADRRFPSGIQQGMHQPGGIGDPDAGGLVVTRSRGEGLERPTQLDESPAQPVSTDADDQEGMTTREQLVARGTRRRGRPRASAGSSSRATAPTGDPDVGLSAPTQRTSGRLRGDQLEPDVVHRYMPIRRGRGRSKDPDDQLGGGAAPRGVHALIADLQDMDGPWSDFKHTYIPGINETWEDRASYKTLNAVVMSATLDPSVPQALDSGDPTEPFDAPSVYGCLQQGD
ncbi:hypothetical protein A1F94_012826 [Pyrenophora tritici-repentis]|nr:hypothetical protein A1F94_012826 [Pyrenophora tritici-repentis]